jgi:hypothetical protein
MRWVGHGESMGEYEKCVHNLAKNLKERDHFRYLGIDVRIILEGILKKCTFKVCTRLNWHRVAFNDGLL